MDPTSAGYFFMVDLYAGVVRQIVRVSQLCLSVIDECSALKILVGLEAPSGVSLYVVRWHIVFSIGQCV